MKAEMSKFLVQSLVNAQSMGRIRRPIENKPQRAYRRRLAAVSAAGAILRS